jgi:hypothetical protein
MREMVFWGTGVLVDGVLDCLAMVWMESQRRFL